MEQREIIRLAIHLVSGFIIGSGGIWVYLNAF
jgi:hypothetical protein